MTKKKEEAEDVDDAEEEEKDDEPVLTTAEEEFTFSFIILLGFLVMFWCFHERFILFSSCTIWIPENINK